jgi:chromosome transmission fidelity protein 4
MRFEGEEVKAVALGAGWVAAVTSLNFLRIFTEGGLQVILSFLTSTIETFYICLVLFLSGT